MNFTIVTATFNCKVQLQALIVSLRAQSDSDFEWVVADGASQDGTLELLHSVDDLKLVLSSQPDFGIYDALNRGIRLSTGDYYIVVGADDRLDPDAIANFRKAARQSSADVITATALLDGRRCSVRSGPVWLHGAHVFIGNHSLSTAFRKDLHSRFGYYTRTLPIGADALFIVKACKGGATRHEASFNAGTIGTGGVSAADWAGSATEVFRMQLATGASFGMQVLLLLLRLVKGHSTAAQRLVASWRRSRQ